MINSFKNPAIMRILRTTERHGAGWREQNFIPHHEAFGLNLARKPRFQDCGFRFCAFTADREIILDGTDYKQTEPADGSGAQIAEFPL